ncbi:hypothetical protein TG4357_01150 [Thalassovita gelatinovora]|uniref:Flp pilus assembly protein, pilin Flp n=1 Tax=Thalassovita gelatinovora TaxID=53501 RepID=A0A0N7LUR3_THAGE|nr:hypothetical protein [Thalassovita gelatinovora]QIZ80312.1 hypothetical protein HFZ77_07410 [Thalassovita gelatinovora]CUH64218.1 hypothetical protein TG4357_01150 [Thalassovita gelatinovora]SEQ94933.1 hypothetical protein SAMN04488043_111105 [Thalassovita gelatinovora]
MLHQIKSKIHRYSMKECGAVTIEWVVLTAAIVGIAIAATIPVFSGTESVAETASSSMQTAMTEAGATN